MIAKPESLEIEAVRKLYLGFNIYKQTQKLIIELFLPELNKWGIS